MTATVQILQDGWTALNSRSRWVDTGQAPTAQELEVSATNPEGHFWRDGDEIHARYWARYPGAQLCRVVYT